MNQSIFFFWSVSYVSTYKTNLCLQCDVRWMDIENSIEFSDHVFYERHENVYIWSIENECDQEKVKNKRSKKSDKFGCDFRHKENCMWFKHSFDEFHSQPFRIMYGKP